MSTESYALLDHGYDTFNEYACLIVCFFKSILLCANTIAKHKPTESSDKKPVV